MVLNKVEIVETDFGTEIGIRKIKNENDILEILKIVTFSI